MKSARTLIAASTRAASLRTATRSTVSRSPQLSFTAQREVTQSRSFSASALFSRYQIRTFTSSSSVRIVLSPTEPKAPNTESHGAGETHEQIELSDSEYHEIADQYLNTLQLRLEELADQASQKGLEVEFSAGVLTISHPSKGDYVLNKQPPNKQIWLSSPVSGPKRYDWVASRSEDGGMDTKQDSEHHTEAMGDNGELGGGRWIYLRDGSSLTAILENELGVVVSMAGESDATAGREGPGASGASPAST